jgi:hypothetical protein
LEYLSTELECFLQGWNAFERIGMPSRGLELLCTGLECFLEGWYAFDRGGLNLYRVVMLSRRL